MVVLIDRGRNLRASLTNVQWRSNPQYLDAVREFGTPIICALGEAGEATLRERQPAFLS